MIKKQEILKYIKDKDDKILYSKVLEQLTFCEKNYEKTFTEFLPILKASEILSYINKYNIEQNIKVFGGYENAERVIILFSPEYLEIEDEDFTIDVLEISYNEKYSRELTHRDFLGSIIGLGIDRSKIGDIILEGNKAICFVQNSISSYIETNLERVGSTKVKVKSSLLKEYDIPKPKYEEKTIIVSSLRLDSVLGHSFNLARGKIANIIKGEKAFLNWALETNVSKIVKENDIITLRGFGRIKILEITGKTKKDRIVLNIIKYS
ncbi:MAG: hypothetical protein K2F59_03090 [Eubacteriales bacterium]|nr:hypothetical protein [Eubacteriales bacterium]